MSTDNGASINADTAKHIGKMYVLVDYDYQTILAKTISFAMSDMSEVERLECDKEAKSKLRAWEAKLSEEMRVDLYCEVYTADYATSSNLGYGLTKLDVARAHTVYFV